MGVIAQPRTDSPIVVQVPPPELALYPEAQSIYDDGSSAGLANGTSTVIASIQLTAANVGVINSFIIYGVNVVAGLIATWTVRVNTVPLTGASRTLPQQTAAAASIAWGPDEILWRIEQGALIDVLVSVVAGGPAELGAQIAGWQHPTPTRDRYAHAWR